MKKNMAAALAAKFIAIITGLIVQHQILVAYGSIYNGLTSSISQIMSYLALLEAGLGAASIQAFYEPLADNRWNRISGIFTATGKAYNKISVLFGGLLVAVSLLLPLAVSGEVDYFTAGLLTLITGGSSVLSYIVGGKYKTLLTADKRIYILYYLDIFSISLSCVLRVLALKNGCGIILVQLINLATVGIKNIGYVIYVREKYDKLDYHSVPDNKSIGKRWNVLIHQITGVVVNHTDVTILTIFSSLKVVSVYSVYNMVFSQMSTLLSSIFAQAPQATFGNLYYKDKNVFIKFFHIYETFFTILLFILTSIALTMILPFVNIYTKGVSDIEYIDIYLPILFSLILLMNQIRTPSIIVVNVTGAFKETQRGAILEAVINIVVSLFLFFFTPLGLYGLLIGTICSYIYRTTDVIIYNYKNVLKESCWKFLKLISINSITMIVLYVVFCVICPIHVDGFFQWIFYSCCITIITTVAFLSFNLLANRDDTVEGLRHLRQFIMRKS